MPLAALRSCSNPIGEIAVSLASEVMLAQESNDIIRCTSLLRLGPTTAPRPKGDTVCRGPCVPLVCSNSRAIGSGTASILIDDCSTPGEVLGAFIEKGSFSKDFPGMMSTVVDVDFDLGISAIPQVVSMAQAGGH
jgi:hypothetical protein